MRRPPPMDDDRKRRWKFGQNFLVDESVVRQIAEDAAPKKTDWVVEIGPGQGAITRRLLPECAKLTAIEVDPKWVEHLRSRDWGALDVVQADATRVDVAEILAREPGKKPIVVGNLPYNRAAPILFRFLPFIHRFQSMQIMVQYEVAKRICAKPHSRDFGFLTVFIRTHCEPEFLHKIGQEAFRPRPKVFSATVRLVPLPAPKIEDPLFLRFVEIAFSRKRKKVVNSLIGFYRRDKVVEALNALKDMTDDPEEHRVNADSRAEDLSVDQFVELFKRLGPPPGVLAKAEIPSIALADMESGPDGDTDEETDGEAETGEDE
ncbi:MAG: ribosomal RNA small subunit methyltransferase A [Fibrobacteres bacterium]|nr:ribosomal RNA small subunit methyltransferase A [Fibrobacterota bacterium]